MVIQRTVSRWALSQFKLPSSLLTHEYQNKCFPFRLSISPFWLCWETGSSKDSAVGSISFCHGRFSLHPSSVGSYSVTTESQWGWGEEKRAPETEADRERHVVFGFCFFTLVTPAPKPTADVVKLDTLGPVLVTLFKLGFTPPPPPSCLIRWGLRVSESEMKAKLCSHSLLYLLFGLVVWVDS